MLEIIESYDSTNATTKAGVGFGEFAKCTNSTESVISIQAKKIPQPKKKANINKCFLYHCLNSILDNEIKEI